MKKNIWIGHLLDRYDGALFALAAPSLSSLFFAFEDPIYNLIATFCLMPLGLISKPLGAYFFGRLGDLWGYRKSFSTTLLGMSLVTGSIALLPTYEQIGVWAPILLGLSRLLQNFFSAGETTGAALIALSEVEEKKRTFVSSLIDAFGILGTILASLSCLLIHSLGISWRFLFLTGFIVGFFGWMIRRKNSTPLKMRENSPSSWRVLWQYKREVFSIAAVSGFSYANYYLITLFFNGFIPLIGLASPSEVMKVHTWLLGFDFCLLPLAALFIRNREKWMRTCLGLAAFFAFPLYWVLDPVQGGNWIVVRMAFMIVGVCLSAPFHAWSQDVAPLEHRYIVKAMGTAIGSRLLGAPAPALALWLYQSTGLIWAPALIVFSTALLAFIFMPQTRKESEPVYPV